MSLATSAGWSSWSIFCTRNFHSCELCMVLFYWLGRSQVFCEECLSYASMVRYARCEVLNQSVTLCMHCFSCSSGPDICEGNFLILVQGNQPASGQKYNMIQTKVPYSKQEQITVGRQTEAASMVYSTERPERPDEVQCTFGKGSWIVERKSKSELSDTDLEVMMYGYHWKWTV